MAELPMHRRTDADLEVALRELGATTAWPPAAPSPDAPDIAAAVRARIVAAGAQPPGRRGWSWRPARRALVLALLAVLALAAVASAIGFDLPGLRFIFGGPSMSPPPTLAPSAGPPGAALDLGNQVGLADLDDAAGFHVRWPRDAAFGPPDAAYIDATRNGQVSLVWTARPGLPASLEPGVGLVLTVFDGAVDDGFFSKVIGAGTTVELVNVDDGRGYWVSGDPHLFFYQTRDGRFIDEHRRWVGDGLLWDEGDLTYRLESPLGKSATVRLAESMR
jgi:hypothetical protein